MAKQTINIGSAPNDGTGDTARDAFDICNDNFTELYDGKVEPNTAFTGDLVFNEAADHASTPAAGKGYLWVKSTAPSTLVFTDDSGADTTLGSGGGASQLSDLSDVNTSTPTNRNVLVADGVDWESRALTEADISDFGTYLTSVEGTDVLSTGPVTDGYVLTADGAGGAAWEAASGGGGTPGGSSGDIQYNNGGSFAGSYLKQGINLIEQYNSTNAQSFLLFNTRTDASNYERGFMKWNSNELQIGTESGGTGSNRSVSVLLPETSGVTDFTVNNSNVDAFRVVSNGNTMFTSTAIVAAFNPGNGHRPWVLDGGGSNFSVASGYFIGFADSSTNAYGGTKDTKLHRSAAGVVGVTNALRIGETAGYTVATLSTGSVGMIARVTDANAPAVGSTVAGSGAAAALVWYNGSNWTVIGV